MVRTSEYEIIDKNHPWFNDILKHYTKLSSKEKCKKYILNKIETSYDPRGGYSRYVTAELKKEKFIVQKNSSNQLEMFTYIYDLDEQGKRFDFRIGVFYYKGNLVKIQDYYSFAGKYYIEFYYNDKEALNSWAKSVCNVRVPDKFTCDADKVSVKNILKFLKRSDNYIDDAYKKMRLVEERIKQIELQKQEEIRNRPFIKYNKHDNYDIFKKIHEYHLALLDTQDDELFTARYKCYSDYYWITESGRETRERINEFLVSNLNGRDILFIHNTCLKMSIGSTTTLFYYNGNLVECTDGRYADSYKVYHKEREDEALKNMRNIFVDVINRGLITRVSKNAMKHLCDFLHINQQDREQYYELCRKKSRPNKN